MEMLRRMTIIGLVVLLLALSFQVYGFAAGGDDPTVELGGTVLQASAHIDGGNVYLPLRVIAEKLGYEVQWSGNDRVITLSGLKKNISIDLKQYKITVGDHEYYMDGDYTGNFSGGGTIIANRTYLGEAFFTEVLGLDIQWDRQNGKVSLKSTMENTISVKTVKETSEDQNIKITIQYPQIAGLSDAAIRESINGVFKNAAAGARSEGMKNADDLAGYKAENPGNPNKCETFFDYRLKYNQNGLISVVFLDYQYSGGAHGMTVQSSHTFNLESGREYQLKDLFSDGSDYISAINAEVIKGIDEKVRQGLLPDVPLTPFKTIREDQDFYLSGNSLFIYFQQYEYYPYAAGILEFPVEFPVLNSVLSPDIRELGASIKLLESSAVNTLVAGETAKVVLKGNSTTGYTWHYSIDNSDVIRFDSAGSVKDSGLLGAGSTYTWYFKAVKAGQAKITFKYYRDWEGEASATPDNTFEYLVRVIP